MTLFEIGYQIRGAAFDTYNELGPGLLESVYEKAMTLELKARGLRVKNQVALDVFYKGQNLDLQYRLDLLVEDQVIVELKSIQALLPVHYKQVITYLKLAAKPLGYLINFNTDNLKINLIRLANDPNNPELINS